MCEFPHGSTESEAREAVAELLFSRARDRRAEGLTLRRVGNLQPDRSAAGKTAFKLRDTRPVVDGRRAARHVALLYGSEPLRVEAIEITLFERPTG